MSLADMAGGVNNAIQEQMLTRLKAQAVQREIAQQQFENQMKEKQFTSGEELKRAQLADLSQSRHAAEDDRQNTYALKLGDEVPAGAQVPQDSPALAPLQRVGLASMNGMQAQAPPTALLANGDQGQPKEIPGTMPNSPMPSGPRLYTKRPSAKQIDTEADNTRQADATAEQHRHDLAMEGKQPAQPNPQPQMFIGPDGKTHAVQFVGGQAREIPLPTDYRKPNGTLDNRLASAQAVSQTGDDIVKQLSDPTFASTIGPALGRYNTLRDFMGNPPPEFAQLAGEIESYALANMGVHGMRSAQGAEQIKALLDKHHTPESMVAAIKGLNTFSQHFMENSGRTTTTSAPASGGQEFDFVNGQLVPRK